MKNSSGLFDKWKMFKWKNKKTLATSNKWISNMQSIWTKILKRNSLQHHIHSISKKNIFKLALQKPLEFSWKNILFFLNGKWLQKAESSAPTRSKLTNRKKYSKTFFLRLEATLWLEKTLWMFRYPWRSLGNNLTWNQLPGIFHMLQCCWRSQLMGLP